MYKATFFTGEDFDYCDAPLFKNRALAVEKANLKVAPLLELLQKAKERLVCTCPKWVEIPCLACDLIEDIDETLEKK